MGLSRQDSIIKLDLSVPLGRGNEPAQQQQQQAAPLHEEPSQEQAEISSPRRKQKRSLLSPRKNGGNTILSPRKFMNQMRSPSYRRMGQKGLLEEPAAASSSSSPRRGLLSPLKRALSTRTVTPNTAKSNLSLRILDDEENAFSSELLTAEKTSSKQPTTPQTPRQKKTKKPTKQKKPSPKSEDQTTVATDISVDSSFLDEDQSPATPSTSNKESSSPSVNTWHSPRVSTRKSSATMVATAHASLLVASPMRKSATCTTTTEITLSPLQKRMGRVANSSPRRRHSMADKKDLQRSLHAYKSKHADSFEDSPSNVGAGLSREMSFKLSSSQGSKAPVSSTASVHSIGLSTCPSLYDDEEENDTFFIPKTPIMRRSSLHALPVQTASSPMQIRRNSMHSLMRYQSSRSFIDDLHELSEAEEDDESDAVTFADIEDEEDEDIESQAETMADLEGQKDASESGHFSLPRGEEDDQDVSDSGHFSVPDFGEDPPLRADYSSPQPPHCRSLKGGMRGKSFRSLMSYDREPSSRSLCTRSVMLPPQDFDDMSDNFPAAQWDEDESEAMTANVEDESGQFCIPEDSKSVHTDDGWDENDATDSLLMMKNDQTERANELLEADGLDNSEKTEDWEVPWAGIAQDYGLVL